MLSSSAVLENYCQPTVAPLPAYIVEDSPIIRANLIATLEELCDVKVVATAETESEASSWLNQPEQEWRLAIVDLFLRSGSGLKVLAACRDRKPEQKVVVLSNYATADMRKSCLSLGANAVFDKSNELDALIDYCISLSKN